jgi:hypothetical protein
MCEKVIFCPHSHISELIVAGRKSMETRHLWRYSEVHGHSYAFTAGVGIYEFYMAEFLFSIVLMRIHEI